MKTLTAFCDLALCPVSYDFVVWLMRALVERDRRGCDHLHVVLVPHEQGLGGFARNWGEHDEPATRWRLWHIVMDCIPLAGATVTLAASKAQSAAIFWGTVQQRADAQMWQPQERSHLAGQLIEDCRAGKGFKTGLRPTEAARRYVAQWFDDDPRPLITLTTRRQETHADRNSSHDAWDSFYGWLPESKYSVVRLEDSHDGLAHWEGCWAQISADLRLALYERAALNCIGTNGPAILLWFSGAPFLEFGFGLPAEVWAEHMEKHLSLKHGEQLPWATPNQRLVWRPDTFAVMREEFEAWERARS